MSALRKTRTTATPWRYSDKYPGYNAVVETVAGDGMLVAVFSSGFTTGGGGLEITDAEAKRNAKRAVLCVNNCAGLTDKQVVAMRELWERSKA